jgi:hypothetical protein
MRKDIFIILGAIILLVLLVIKGCPACAKLTQPRENSQTDYPSEQTVSRSKLLSTHDFDCLVYFCTSDCNNQTNATLRKSWDECRTECSAPEKIKPNTDNYPQCRKQQ